MTHEAQEDNGNTTATPTEISDTQNFKTYRRELTYCAREKSQHQFYKIQNSITLTFTMMTQQQQK